MQHQPVRLNSTKAKPFTLRDPAPRPVPYRPGACRAAWSRCSCAPAVGGRIRSPSAGRCACRTLPRQVEHQITWQPCQVTQPGNTSGSGSARAAPFAIPGSGTCHPTETCFAKNSLIHEAREKRRRLGGGPLYLADGQPRWLAAVVEGHAGEECLQDLRAGHGGPGRRHAQRAGALA